jgi:hypothetical protein
MTRLAPHLDGDLAQCIAAHGRLDRADCARAIADYRRGVVHMLPRPAAQRHRLQYIDCSRVPPADHVFLRTVAVFFYNPEDAD